MRVCVRDALMPTLPALFRQLNYAEVPSLDSGAMADAAIRRDVYLIDGTLDGAYDLCRCVPRDAAKIFLGGANSFAARKRCADAGVDAVVADPPDARELADWLEHFDDRSASGRATVLIIDDDELAAECVAALLAVRGIDAEIVGDPTRALDVLERTSVDLVLLDLDMPDINGVDLARMIRQNRRYLSMPIVYLSAEEDPELQMNARSFGGDDFICKRTDRALLVRLLELRIERARVLRTLIERDGLTGLVHHARFVERVGQEVARCRRTGSDLSLVLIDIDYFKAVNDTWGHQSGDFVLRRLAASLSAHLRRTDIVGRYGGEEFGVLMLDTPPDRAGAVIDGFRRQFSALDLAAPGGSFRVTFSAGVADGQRACDTAALIADADAALYRAKSSGRNQVVVADGRPPVGPAARLSTFEPTSQHRSIPITGRST